MRKSKSLLYVALFTVLFWTIIVLLFCGCSVEKRLNRLVKNHPELIDTTKKNIIKSIETKIIVDSSSIDSLGQLYLKELAKTNADIDSLKLLKDCDKIATVIKERIKYIDRLKKQTDTVYSFVKCEIMPFSIDTLGMSIKVAYVNGKSLISITSKQANIVTCEDSKFWQFKEFWVVVILLILAIYLKR